MRSEYHRHCHHHLWDDDLVNEYTRQATEHRTVDSSDRFGMSVVLVSLDVVVVAVECGRGVGTGLGERHYVRNVEASECVYRCRTKVLGCV